jgi:hypothetical protein
MAALKALRHPKAAGLRPADSRGRLSPHKLFAAGRAYTPKAF